MPDFPRKSHDEFFKASFGRLEIARDYLEQLLPQDVHQTLDLSQLERMNGAWVTPELEEYFSDVIYRCPLKEGKSKVWISFLFEHKSSIDGFPHLQLLRYLLDAWQEQHKQKQPLSPIVPIVVYHGLQKWHKRDLSSYFGKSAGDRLIANADDLAMYLLEKAHVSTVTGGAFGEPDCIRISYAASRADLQKGFGRIKDALAALN